MMLCNMQHLPMHPHLSYQHPAAALANERNHNVTEMPATALLYAQYG